MNKTLRTACMLRERGFAVHWLRGKSKAPVDTGWATAPIQTTAQLERTYRDGYNVGFRPGKWSVVDGHEIVVIDVDIRGGEAYAEEAYSVANSTLGGAFDPQVQTGSGFGRHQFVRTKPGTSPEVAATTLRQSDIWVLNGEICAPGFKGARPAYVVELLSTGKNVVLPPSIHPDTGKAYVGLDQEEQL